MPFEMANHDRVNEKQIVNLFNLTKIVSVLFEMVLATLLQSARQMEGLRVVTVLQGKFVSLIRKDNTIVLNRK